jgi:Outer membrane protein beta-barrel domain
MKMDVRTSVALCLLVGAVTAAAQIAPQEQTVPAPQQSAPTNPPPPSPPPPQTTPPDTQPAQNSQSGTAPAQEQQPNAPPPPPQNTQPPPPATPPLPRLPSQQYHYAPPPRQYAAPQWVHSETKYYDDGFQYHPFRFHIDGGGTITQQANAKYLDNGWNAGLGFTWYPTSHLPLGIRVDGSYNDFTLRRALLDRAQATYQSRVDSGNQRMWGGDVDLQLDLHLSPYIRAYLLAGGGWYKQQTTYRQTNYQAGYICYWFGCGPGYYGVTGIVARNTTEWHFARNAGFGFEFAMGPWTSFFVEARYMRLDPRNAKSDFLPIRAGLRF